MFPCTSWVKTVEVCVLFFSYFWWAGVNKFICKLFSSVLKHLLTVISVLKLIIPIIILCCYAKLLISTPEVFYRGYR